MDEFEEVLLKAFCMNPADGGVNPDDGGVNPEEGGVYPAEGGGVSPNTHMVEEAEFGGVAVSKDEGGVSNESLGGEKNAVASIG